MYQIVGWGSVFSHHCVIDFVVWDCNVPIVRRGERKRLCAGAVFPVSFAISIVEASIVEDSIGNGTSSHVDRLVDVSLHRSDEVSQGIGIKLIDNEMSL